VGSAAVRRVDHHGAVEWASGVLASRDTAQGFRLPRPIAAEDGRWIVDGWSASTWLSGEGDGSRWRQILQAGEVFHEWLADIERPAWIDETDDPWRLSDRMAWGEQPTDVRAEFAPLIKELTSMRQPVSAKSQLVHGDLTGNVLFSEGLPPGIIDLSLYWRPPGYAAAIAAVDCYEWESVGAEVLDQVAELPDGEQLLIRAALFRIIRAGMVKWANGEDRLNVHRGTVSAIRSRIR
jgi:uncharacterized protein (TIGR02569 family)